ncbi:hypothetical protein PIB30_077661 [Stylosanthes scabra]|uniref:Uncharacterized protein n=1 Tax=Stylosanthes scabra TaxID=79078 RepID=A0ABU6TTJ3_9FABA|nr:hypothetical protein [Stylosanthes scabra]
MRTHQWPRGPLCVFKHAETRFPLIRSPFIPSQFYFSSSPNPSTHSPLSSIFIIIIVHHHHHQMDHKRNQAALKRKEKVRVPSTRVSPRLATLRTPQSPPLKTRTPPSRASLRLTALKDP